MSQATIQLAQGTVRYRDEGSGAPIVFVHGYLVDGRLWADPAQRLAAEGFRCLTADWPMGSHTIAMNPDADLSPPGVAATIADFIERLGLERATIVGNDSGGAISQILTANHPERVERLVLTNCDTFEHFPPAAFKPMVPLARIPGVMSALALPLRSGAIRRAAFRPFAKRPIPPALVDSWLAPSQQDAAVARDMRKFVVGLHKRHTLAAAERLRSFERPIRFAWGVEDRFFKLEHARRLAAMVPDAAIVEIPDAKTFAALDQPALVAEAIAGFVRESEAAGAGAAAA